MCDLGQLDLDTFVILVVFRELGCATSSNID